MLSTLHTPLLDEAFLREGQVNRDPLSLSLYEGGENKENPSPKEKTSCFSRLFSLDVEEGDFQKLAKQLFKLNDPDDEIAVQDIYI